MKKLLAMAFIGGLIMASCAKKETTEDNSNTMMSEPDTAMTGTNGAVEMDSTAIATPTVTDSTTTTPQ